MSKVVDATWQRILEIKIDDKVATFTELYEKNYKGVHKYFLREFRDWHEAEDLTQDAFLRIYVYLFRKQENVSELSAKEQTLLNYFIKNAIRSIRWNRGVNMDRRIDAITESAMYDNPNSTETPLEQATNAAFSLAGPYQEVRIRNFVEDVKLSFKGDKVGEALLYIFFGCSHDEAQKKAGVSHGTFYRSLKSAKTMFGSIVSKHFDTSEYNGID